MVMANRHGRLAERLTSSHADERPSAGKRWLLSPVVPPVVPSSLGTTSR